MAYLWVEKVYLRPARSNTRLSRDVPIIVKRSAVSYYWAIHGLRRPFLLLNVSIKRHSYRRSLEE